MKKLLLFVSLCLVVSVPAAQAGVLAPTKASQVVVARASTSGSCSYYTGSVIDLRMMPDGTTQPFIIPNGQVFVVTGISWTMASGTAGNHAGIGLALESGDGSPLDLFFTDGDKVAADGTTGRLVPVSNVVVAPGPTLCVAYAGALGVLTSARIQGFFAKDK